jgi:integrase
VELDGARMVYKKYRSQVWDPVMKKYGYDYTPHDTRHTFITLMDEAEVNKLVVKMIVGHSTKDITEHYTHKNIQQMLEAVNKI